MVENQSPTLTYPTHSATKYVNNRLLSVVYVRLRLLKFYLLNPNVEPGPQCRQIKWINSCSLCLWSSV